ncbi:hypothetical protein [Nocardia fluminea]|uniref:hypothetical protein n=1 Tax=Nocardia fluminea TaxID=134984 RepID=UPI00365CD6D7
MTGMGWMELVAAVVGTGVVSTGLTLWFGRRKANADAEVTLSGGYGELVRELRAERKELREQLVEAHTDNQAMLTEVTLSRTELSAARLEVSALTAEVRAVKDDLRRVLNGKPPIGDWFT